jgi:hypothetical protein
MEGEEREKEEGNRREKERKRKSINNCLLRSVSLST